MQTHIGIIYTNRFNEPKRKWMIRAFSKNKVGIKILKRKFNIESIICKSSFEGYFVKISNIK